MAYCTQCRQDYVTKTERYVFESPYVGAISISNATYQQCPSCQEVLLPMDIALEVEQQEEQRLNNWLASQPIDAFVAQNEVADLLGISKQAVSKHKRIQAGFIYFIERFGKRLYLRESVERFKECEEGRFSIADRLQSQDAEPASAPAAISDASKPIPQDEPVMNWQSAPSGTPSEPYRWPAASAGDTELAPAA